MIIVLGPGRCGSSTVARILHNHLHIPMGSRFHPADDSNLNGFFEDLDFRDLNHRVLNNQFSEDSFQERMDQLVAKRSERWGEIQWGIKDPRICHLWVNYRKHFAKYIVCTRRPQLVIRSMMSNYGWTEEESKQLLTIRLRGIEKLLEGQDALRIDFSIRRDETELTHLLKRMLQ